MTEQILSYKSVRFFPNWNEYEPDQIIGFISLIQHIIEKKPYVDKWVELGSYIGESANLVLAHKAIKHIVCVDSALHLIKLFSKRHQKYIESGRCSIYNRTSYDFLKEIPFNYMDVIYIDADHEYDAIKTDIDLSFIKLQKNGFLCGHDYDIKYRSSPGVLLAVDEFSKKNGLEIIKFPDTSWLIHKE